MICYLKTKSISETIRCLMHVTESIKLDKFLIALGQGISALSRNYLTSSLEQNDGF